MTDIALRRARRQKMFQRAGVGLILALLSPLTVFLAVAGLKSGVLSIETAFDLMTIKIALGLAAVGVIGAVIALIAGLAEFKSAGMVAVAAVLISAVTVAVFSWSIVQAGQARGAGDVATNADEPPGFSTAVLAQRRAAGADPVPTVAGPAGCEITAPMTQVPPGAAGYGLQSAGFDVRGLGVGRADGAWTSFWFNRTYDGVVRIRPGRTDVRVTARDLAHDRGQACRLAGKIATNMLP
jgi:hypothetical protein